LPEIREFLDVRFCEDLVAMLSGIPMEFFDMSTCVQRDVSRVPLKLDGLTPDEEAFLGSSNDGLRHFECFDIHDFNVQSREGLIKTLKAAQVYTIAFVFTICIGH